MNELEEANGQTFLTTGRTHGFAWSSRYAPTPKSTFLLKVSALYAAMRLKRGSAGARGTVVKADADIGRFGKRWFWMESRRVFGREEEVEGEVGGEERWLCGDIFAAADGGVIMYSGGWSIFFAFGLGRSSCVPSWQVD